MPTKTTSRVMRELQNLPEVEYPEEVVERWEKEVEIAKLQIATGELTPVTAADIAAKYGLVLDE